MATSASCPTKKTIGLRILRDAGANPQPLTQVGSKSACCLGDKLAVDVQLCDALDGGVSFFHDRRLEGSDEMDPLAFCSRRSGNLIPFGRARPCLFKPPEVRRANVE